jgi:hypothetical protein
MAGPLQALRLASQLTDHGVDNPGSLSGQERMPENHVQVHIAKGLLVRVLADGCNGLIGRKCGFCPGWPDVLFDGRLDVACNRCFEQ